MTPATAPGIRHWEPITVAGAHPVIICCFSFFSLMYYIFRTWCLLRLPHWAHHHYSLALQGTA
jgi:hypothetical protein